MMRYARWAAQAAIGLLLIAALFPVQVGQAQNTVLNYFAQVAGGSSDNVLNIDGTLNFEDKATVIDHGTATLANGYASVTTNLSSTVTCVLTLNTGAATPGDDPVLVTGLWTPGSSGLEILAWATNGTDPTLIAASSTDTVGYVCMGAD